MFPLKHGGLALATSLASAVNVFMLSVILWKKIGAFLDRAFCRSLVHVLISSAVMAGAIYLVGFFITWNVHASLQARCLYLAVCVSSGLTVFFSASLLTGNPELLFFLDHLKRRVLRP
jgi:putative peptidoglycan lipid II flippase